MPSTRHSYATLTAVIACVLVFCCFLFWQNRQKKNKMAQQYAELSAPGAAQEMAPEQQKALLELLSRNKDDASPENLLSFRGVPYIMFTRSSPPCPVCDESTETFCLFPDGRVLIISQDQDGLDDYSLSVSRDEHGKATDGVYFHKLFWVGSWGWEGVRPRRLVIRLEDQERFNGSLHADSAGVPTLEENVPPEIEDDPEIVHPTHQYRAQHISPETEKLCQTVAPLLDAPEIYLPLEHATLAIQAMAEKLHVEEDFLTLCLILDGDYPPGLYVFREDKPDVLYRLTRQETKTKVEELSHSSRQPVSTPFLLDADFSRLNAVVQDMEQALHGLPAPDRGNTYNIGIKVFDQNTVEITAMDCLESMSGSVTTYMFQRMDGRWKLIGKSEMDC